MTDTQLLLPPDWPPHDADVDDKIFEAIFNSILISYIDVDAIRTHIHDKYGELLSDETLRAGLQHALHSGWICRRGSSTDWLHGTYFVNVGCQHEMKKHVARLWTMVR